MKVLHLAPPALTYAWTPTTPLPEPNAEPIPTGIFEKLKADYLKFQENTRGLIRIVKYYDQV